MYRNKLLRSKLLVIDIAIVPFRIMSLGENIVRFVPLMVLGDTSLLKYIYGKGTEICNQ